MRVTFNAIYREAAAGLERSNERMLEWQRQVATGMRIEKPSDDPSAMANAIVERGDQATVERYTEAANSAGARLQVIDVVLGDIQDKLSAALVATHGARGSVVTPAQREAAAAQLESLRDSVLQNLNTQFRGTYIFGGASATTQPYTKDAGGTVGPYAASTATVDIEISSGETVTIAHNGEAIAKGTAADDVFVVFERTIAAVRAGDDAALATGMDDLQAAFDRAVAAQSRVGASMNAIDEGKLRLAQSARSIKERISALEEANMAEAITGMTQAESAYQAALGAAATVNRASLMDYLK